MLAAILAGVILMVMGLTGLGKLASLVPHSIVVGFTIGIAVTIALSQVGEVLGLHAGFKLTEHELVELEKKACRQRRSPSCTRLTEREFATRTQFLGELGHGAHAPTSWTPARRRCSRRPS